MAYKRIYTQYVTTAANANEQAFALTTEDNYQLQHIKGIYAGIATAGVTIRLYVTGDVKGIIDCTRFASGNQPVHLECDVPAGIAPTVSVQDLAGNAHTNLPIILEYEVDQG